ncbi:MAG: MoxR family ATPase [Polyangiaceae bacterium]
MDKPLLVEGPAGVGKTDLARALAEALGRSMVRLQCYEGLDEAKALYEWDYPKQMLFTQLVRESVAGQTAGAKTLGGSDGPDRRRRRGLLRTEVPSGAPVARARSRVTRRWCSSSTRSTAPTPSSRRSCWSSWPSDRSRSPRSAP